MTAVRIRVATTGLALTMLMISPVSVRASGRAKLVTCVSITGKIDIRNEAKKDENGLVCLKLKMVCVYVCVCVCMCVCLDDVSE